jgi:hypothetical protein
MDSAKLLNVGVLAGCAGIWLLLQSRIEDSTLNIAFTRLALFAAAVSGVALAAPVLRPGFPLAHDAGVHPTHAFLFNQAIGDGQFPVRWVEWIEDGLGQPVFNYYHVGFYYFVELLHVLGPGLDASIKLAIVFLWTVGAVFVFLLFRPLGVLPAALAASVFAWSPYLMLDAFVRTAYPELAAVALAPGVLWTMDGVLRSGRRWCFCALSLTTCLLLLSHLLTAMIVAPLCAGLLVAGFASGHYSAKQILQSLLAIALGIAMASFFVVPALTELAQIKAGGLTRGYFDYHLHFVDPRRWFDWSWGYGGSALAADDPMSVQIGVVQWFVIAAALMVVGVASARQRFAATHARIVVWLLAIGAAMVMMTSASRPVWELISPLKFLQFPWRFLMVPTLACGALAALLLALVPTKTTQALIVVALVSLQWSVTRNYRREAWDHTRADMCIDTPVKSWTSSCRMLAFREPSFDPITASSPRPVMGRWAVLSGRGEVIGKSLENATIGLTVHAVSPMQLVINTPFVPGWTVSVNDRHVDPVVLPESGYMAITIPPGTSRVDALLRRTPVRIVADTLSLASWLAWLTIGVAPICYRRRSQKLAAATL